MWPANCGEDADSSMLCCSLSLKSSHPVQSANNETDSRWRSPPAVSCCCCQAYIKQPESVTFVIKTNTLQDPVSLWFKHIKCVFVMIRENGVFILQVHTDLINFCCFCCWLLWLISFCKCPESEEPEKVRGDGGSPPLMRHQDRSRTVCEEEEEEEEPAAAERCRGEQTALCSWGTAKNTENTFIFASCICRSISNTTCNSCIQEPLTAVRPAGSDREPRKNKGTTDNFDNALIYPEYM